MASLVISREGGKKKWLIYVEHILGSGSDSKCLVHIPSLKHHNSLCLIEAEDIMNLGNLSKVTCQVISRGWVQSQASLSPEPVLGTTTLTGSSALE